MSKTLSPQLAPGPITLDVVGLSLTAADRQRILHPLTGALFYLAEILQIVLSLLSSLRTLRRCAPMY